MQEDRYCIVPVLVTADAELPAEISFIEDIRLFDIEDEAKERELLKAGMALPPPPVPTEEMSTRPDEKQVDAPAFDSKEEAAMSVLEKVDRFSVALSFAGEYREKYVKPIAYGLVREFGSKKKILYDKFHEGDFAIIGLNPHLPELYRTKSDLIVVFIGEHYNKKAWCIAEWRAILDFLSCPKNKWRVMLLKVDDGHVDGVYDTLDGPLDIREKDTEFIVALIMERYKKIHSDFGDSDCDVLNESQAEIKGKILEKVSGFHDTKLYDFAEAALRNNTSKFFREGVLDLDLDNVIAEILIDFSKIELKSDDTLKQRQRYFCEAMGLIKKNNLANIELLAKCRRLKADLYKKMSGYGPELMAKLLS